jgi:hemoglobin-like flavoprotein
VNRKQLSQVFNDSYERVIDTPGKSREFYSAFYALLIASSDEAASKFRTTDLEKQVNALNGSVTMLMASYASGGGEADYLDKIAERHSRRGLNIAPRLYAVWLDCLIETVRRFDPKFNDGVATAWRGLFSKGIEFMISKYE